MQDTSLGDFGGRELSVGDAAPADAQPAPVSAGSGAAPAAGSFAGFVGKSTRESADPLPLASDTAVATGGSPPVGDTDDRMPSDILESPGQKVQPSAPDLPAIEETPDEGEEGAGGDAGRLAMPTAVPTVGGMGADVPEVPSAGYEGTA